MLKSVQFKIAQIKYKDDSIGRNIRIETEILGEITQTNKRIKPGTTAIINKEIGKIKTDKKSFQTKLSITVIEKDLLFNDIGNITKTFKINASSNKSQQFTTNVPVKETRSIFGKIWGDRKANFEIVLEVRVSDFIKYVPDLDDFQGFLKIKLEKSGLEESLPAYLKIKPEYVKTGKEYFTMLEGPYRDQLAFKELNNNSSWFISGVKHESNIRAKYSISKKLFILNGKKYKTIDDPDFPWRKGLYDIEIPDYPHKGGRNYLNKSKRALTWFKIGHKGDRYLHVGRRSAGCMTIIETNRWMEIYNTLIKARKGDFMSVGELEVID